MVTENERWFKGREAGREADREFRARHGGKSKIEVEDRRIMKTVMCIAITKVIAATAEWRAPLL